MNIISHLIKICDNVFSAVIDTYAGDNIQYFLCGYGGIGRRAGFRFLYRKV